MPGDNNQEMFPIVDEQGNITGAATHGECHSGSKLLHPVIHLHVFKRRDCTQTGGPRRTRYHGLYSRTANQLCIRIGS